MSDEPITEDWLKEVGFKWHQFDRQPDKHWLLWLGEAAGECYEDLGIEVATMAPFRSDDWFCWLRGDSAGRYHRFIHVRHIKTRWDLVRMIEGLTGQDWDPANNLHGIMRTPERAAKLRLEHERIDQRLMREGHKWAKVEEDDTRGRALPEHMEVAEKAREGVPTPTNPIAYGGK